MSQMEPTTALDPTLEIRLAAAPKRVRGGLRVPGWLVLLWRNPKSRLGMLMLAFVVIIALIAPLISVADPNGFNLLAAKQSPSWHHLFGTTDQGSDIFSQVVLGARRSLILGAAAATLATVLAATLGIFGASEKAQRVIPNKVFQALACGTPVVTADTPAARELLRDGESALLVPPGDPAALIDAIRRVTPAIGEGGLAAYESHASEAVLGVRWRSLIESVL